MRQIEELSLSARRSFSAGDLRAAEGLPSFDAGGPMKKQEFINRKLSLQLPIVGSARGEGNVYRNLALNPGDAQGQPTCYPHASTNSEYKSMEAFAASNAINGKTDNRGHGRTYPSWGPHKRTDLWWKLEFGP